AGPAGHEHCKFRCRSYGEEKEYAAVYREGRHISSIGNDAQREDCHRGEDDWREKMHHLICARWHDVFLDQHFNAVCDWLEKSERPDAIRSIAILHSCEYFSLQHRDEREKREKHGEQRDNVDETRGDLEHPIRRACNPGKEPVLE